MAMKHLFDLLEREKPDSTLLPSILARIAIEEACNAKWGKRFSFVVALLSLCSAIPASIIAISACMQSGFMAYVSLLGTDGGAIASSQEYVLSLLESIPLVPFILFLAPLFFLGISIHNITRYDHHGIPKLGAI